VTVYILSNLELLAADVFQLDNLPEDCEIVTGLCVIE